MKRSHKQVNLTDIGIWVDVNPRLLLGDDNVRNLALDILKRGLKDPLVVWAHDGALTIEQIMAILKGHRRFMALGLAKRMDPATFADLFPGNKIPVEVISDISELEALEILQDHGQQEGLTSKAEVYKTAKNFFVLGGYTEKKVTLAIQGLLDRVAPLPVKAQKKVDDARAKVDAADNDRARHVAIEELENTIAQVRRGYIQNLNNIRRSPKLVEDSYLYDHTPGSKVGDDVNVDDLIPALTDVERTSLYKVYCEEQAETDNTFDREIPGPKFMKAWNDLKAKKAEVKASTEPRPKAMSAKAMEDDIKEGNYSSQVAKLITKKHCGQEFSSSDLLAADRRSYFADILEKHSPDFWAECLTEAQACIAEAREAAKAAAENGVEPDSSTNPESDDESDESDEESKES